MKMLAADVIAARVIPSPISPLGQLILDEAPKDVSDFAYAIRRIEEEFLAFHFDSEEIAPAFNESDMYVDWYAKELGFQHQQTVIELFGYAESEDFCNAYIDREDLERWITVAHEAAVYIIKLNARAAK